MSRKSIAKVSKNQKAEPDGRRLRSQSSRQKVLNAMWALMLDGAMEPSPSEIAKKAGVGLRTVYRHVENMDAIYRELVLAAEECVAPTQMKPYNSTHWKDQMIELSHRTADLWNRFLIPHTACEIRRFKSAILMDEYRRSRLRELSAVKSILPEDAEDYDMLLGSLDTILCFSTVRRLRHDRNLSLKKTKEIMAHMVAAIVKDVA